MPVSRHVSVGADTTGVGANAGVVTDVVVGIVASSIAGFGADDD